jgi:hypothetical protein
MPSSPSQALALLALLPALSMATSVERPAAYYIHPNNDTSMVRSAQILSHLGLNLTASQ